MAADGPVRAVIFVTGRVQGVGYRAFAHGEASRRGLSGGVRNLEDGRVEVQVEGERSAVDALIGALGRGPRLGRVDDLQVLWETPTGRDTGFHIWP